MKIVLISCVSTKLNKIAKARDLYISPLFKYNLKYAQSLNPDNIFILSAKHGLLTLDEEIEPYNQTLNNMKSDERKEWSKMILTQLKQHTNLKQDSFVFLAGEKYRKYLLPQISNYKIPMKGLGIGKQLQFLKNRTSCCHQLHQLFNNLKRFSFPFNKEELPENGIYILFEKGEQAHNTNRIVRIGTHTGLNQLRSRLKQHFIQENKDRSIFRKNIGRALLNKNNDSFKKQWELDLTTRDMKEKHKNIDFAKQALIEKQVTKQIQENFSFAVIPVENKEKRLKLESKLISTVSLCKQCHSSKEWLGNQSPKQKIRKSGLWLVNELYKEPLELHDFLNLFSNTF